ncbi:hypothetical protein PIB30_067925 [Stylosanthes scabra]|uniref:Uncharacterized protein n=1 Tax=Stylosanthes scabra TaxID=79078 RepID=A0ABU6SMT5_9FABA|nr:hypothetical protein [Stylosanthes scabra]
MAGNDVTLGCLRCLHRPSPSGSTPAISARPPGTSVPPPVVQPGSASGNQAFPEGGLEQCGVVGEPIHEVFSPLHEEVPPSSPSHSKKRQVPDASVDPKRPRVFEGTIRGFCSMDRSFDASGFIKSNLLGPRAQEVLRDYDPMESIRWAEWASLRAATIMKSVKPHLTAADQWENRCIEAEKEKVEAERARLKTKGDLKSASDNLNVLEEEKSREVERRKDRETELEEKARADKAEASLAESERTREELVQMAEDSVAATERALKAQISLLLPDFDVSQLGAFKVIIDGKIVDLPE